VHYITEFSLITRLIWNQSSLKQYKKEKEKTCAEVLPQHNTFLENVGLKISSSMKSRFGVSSQVQVLQSELETKKQESVGLRQEVHALMSQAE
jgi:hypothetical protein